MRTQTTALILRAPEARLEGCSRGLCRLGAHWSILRGPSGAPQDEGQLGSSSSAFEAPPGRLRMRGNLGVPVRDRMMVRACRLLDHPAALLGLAALALHLWVNGSYGYFRDELYFIVCGRHPAWGYTDQPPLMPLIAAASDAAFHSLRGLRLVPALAAAATVALTASAAQMLGGRLY